MPSPPNIAAATWYDDFWTTLDGIIAGAWPEVIGKLRLDNQALRRDWGVMLNDGELGSPWAVVKITAANGTLGITAPHVDITVVVTYIENIETAGDTSEHTGPRATASTWTMRRLQTLWKALQISQTIGTVDNDASFDDSAEVPSNDVLIDQGLNYQAGALTFTAHAITA